MNDDIELYITDIDKIPAFEELEAKEKANPKPPEMTFLISDNISTSVERVNTALDRYNKAYGEKIFYYNGKLALIEKQACGEYTIKNIDRGKLRWILSKAGQWKDFAKMEICKIPFELLESTLSAPASALYNIRNLKGLYKGILLKTNGEIVSKEGYDSDTQLYLTNTSEIRPIPEIISEEDIAESKTVIDEPLKEFMFKDIVDYENAVLALTTIILRQSLEGPTPIYVVDKNTTRAGGTLLCQVLGGAGLGYIPTPMPSTKRSDEIDKQIRSAVKDNMPYAILDNVTPRTDWTPEVLLSLSSGTGTIVSRNMGSYDTFTSGGKTMFAVNGVNMRVSADVCGRVFKSNLTCPTSWQFVRYKRTKAQLFDLAVKQNAEIVRAVAVFLRNWIANGSPSPKPCCGNLSEYPVWYNICAGILEFAGYSNLLDNQMELQTDDNDADVFGKEFIDCLRAKLPFDEFSPQAVLKVLVSEGEARKSGTCDGLLNFAADDIVRAAVSGTLTSQKTGLWLKGFVGCKYAGCEWYLEKVKTNQGMRYKLSPVEFQQTLVNTLVNT